jgi:hypothetical protein
MGIVQQFINSSPDVFQELNEQEGLSPAKVEAALEATLEGAVQEGSDVVGGEPDDSLETALREFSSENGEAFTGRVTQYVAEHGFPEGVAEKVVNLALPKLLELAHRH